MQLQELLADLEAGCLKADQNRDPEIESLEYDSRLVGPGSLFLAVPGLATDGYRYVEEAAERGAAAVVSEREAPPGFPVAWIRVPRVRAAMADLADRFYGSPSRDLELVGITGTNGKTTTAFLLHSIFESRGPALLMGTVKTQLGEEVWEQARTTPEAVDIQKTLDRARRRGCRRGAVEVSSHALHFERVRGCRFPVAVFTNLSRDHLDFHADMQEYLAVKSRLFEPRHNPALRCAVVNGDDAHASGLPGPRGVSRISFGLSPHSGVHPLQFETGIDGTRATLQLPGRRLTLSSPLPGKHNLYNIMAAAAAAAALEVPDPEIAAGIERLASVPGRFERVRTAVPAAVFVDYAHTPHALENVLDLCRSLTRGRIICVFGCGGDRDREKRPAMGAIAAGKADLIIVTSDNPRSEDPAEIIGQILAGVPGGSAGCEVIEDRRQAIHRALEVSDRDDLVLIAGKGHETWQETRDGKIPFDDRQVAGEGS